MKKGGRREMWKQLCIIYTVLLTTPHSIKSSISYRDKCGVTFMALSSSSTLSLLPWMEGASRLGDEPKVGGGWFLGDLHTHKRAHSERDMTT